MTERCIREDRAQKEKLAKERLKQHQAATVDKVKTAPAGRDVTNVLDSIDPAAILNERDNNESFSKVVKLAQEAFEQPIKTSGPINDGYAWIINAELRYVISLLCC